MMEIVQSIVINIWSHQAAMCHSLSRLQHIFSPRTNASSSVNTLVASKKYLGKLPKALAEMEDTLLAQYGVASLSGHTLKFGHKKGQSQSPLGQS
jgi:hypothetical protein